MTTHLAIGILVAVAVPLWLVVEQVLKWRILKPRTSPSLARTETGSPLKAAIPDRPRDMTRAALHRKTS
jgi:hypothetical protein